MSMSETRMTRLLVDILMLTTIVLIVSDMDLNDIGQEGVSNSLNMPRLNVILHIKKGLLWRREQYIF